VTTTILIGKNNRENTRGKK